jgi:hypothetical protein
MRRLQQLKSVRAETIFESFSASLATHGKRRKRSFTSLPTPVVIGPSNPRAWSVNYPKPSSSPCFMTTIGRLTG